MAQKDYKDAFNEYIKLKSSYEQRKDKEINKISKNPNLSKKDKSNEFMKINKCINCNKLGGTIFTQKDNMLIAYCGNSQPCKLNIQLQRSKHTNIVNKIDELNSIIIKNKQDIVKTKLDYLFGYTNQETTVEIFNELKNKLSSVTSINSRINEKFLDIVHNNEKYSKLEKDNNTLLSYITESKQLINNYNETNENIYIKNAVELYVNSILPLVKIIQDTTYSSNFIYTNIKTGTHHLIQEEYTLKDLEIKTAETTDKVILFER